MLKNYYDEWQPLMKSDDDDPDLRHYPNEKLLRIPLPHRAIIQGPSGSMKTNLAMNLIFLIGKFDKIIVCAQDIEEPLYKALQKRMEKIEQKCKTRILLMINDLKDLPDLDAFNPKENTLVIFDDWAATSQKEQIPIGTLFLRGRKKGITSWYLSQGYFNCPQLVRKNSDFVFIKKQGNPQDFKRIAREYAMGIDAKEMEKLYHYAVDDDDKNFFLIDRFSKDPDYRFRKNFAPIDLADFGLTSTKSKWEGDSDADDEEHEVRAPKKESSEKAEKQLCAGKTTRGLPCKITATCGAFCKRHSKPNQ